MDPRLIAILGGVLTSVGFIGASYATDIMQLALCIAVLGGMVYYCEGGLNLFANFVQYHRIHMNIDFKLKLQFKYIR